MDVKKCVPKFNVILLCIETFLMEYIKTSLYQQTSNSVLNYMSL